MMMHTLVIGERNVGKTTLIRAVLSNWDLPLSGYETRKEDGLADPIYGSPVYFYEIGKPYAQTSENLLGYCKNGHPEIQAEAFDRFAPIVRNLTKKHTVILLDEIGFMESTSEAFCASVMELLNGNNPVIAAVKPIKDGSPPFLKAIHKHPRCRRFYLTKETRDDLREEIRDFIEPQLAIFREQKEKCG